MKCLGTLCERYVKNMHWSTVFSGPLQMGHFKLREEKKSSRKHSNTESVLYSLFLSSTDEFDNLLLCLILLKMLLMDFLQTAAEIWGKPGPDWRFTVPWAKLTCLQIFICIKSKHQVWTTSNGSILTSCCVIYIRIKLKFERSIIWNVSSSIWLLIQKETRKMSFLLLKLITFAKLLLVAVAAFEAAAIK